MATFVVALLTLFVAILGVEPWRRWFVGFARRVCGRWRSVGIRRQASHDPDYGWSISLWLPDDLAHRYLGYKPHTKIAVRGPREGGCFPDFESAHKQAIKVGKLIACCRQLPKSVSYVRDVSHWRVDPTEHPLLWPGRRHRGRTPPENENGNA